MPDEMIQLFGPDDGADSASDAAPDAQPGAAGASDSQDASPDVKADVDTQGEGANGDAPAAVIDDEKVEVSKSELEKLRKQVSEKEKFLQRQANDVGKARKEAEAALAALKKQLPVDDESEKSRLTALAVSDGHAFAEELERIRSLKAEIARNENIVREAQRVEANREVIKSLVPELEATIDDVAALVLEDGAPPETVKALRDNPYLLDPTLAYNLHKRASLTKQVAQLSEQLAQLQKENAELKTRPDEVLRKIEKAAAAKPLTGASGGGTSDDRIELDYANPFAVPLEHARKIASGGR